MLKIDIFQICELIVHNAKNEIVKLNAPYGWSCQNYNIYNINK